jgi:hypothetical protein
MLRSSPSAHATDSIDLLACQALTPRKFPPARRRRQSARRRAASSGLRARARPAGLPAVIIMPGSRQVPCTALPCNELRDGNPLPEPRLLMFVGDEAQDPRGRDDIVAVLYYRHRDDLVRLAVGSRSDLTGCMQCPAARWSASTSRPAASPLMGRRFRSASSAPWRQRQGASGSALRPELSGSTPSRSRPPPRSSPKMRALSSLATPNRPSSQTGLCM